MMLSSFLPFSVFMWMAENDSNTLCGWVVFFPENVEKGLRFQKNPDTSGRGLRFRNINLSYYRDINVMTSPLFTKRHQ